MKALRVRLGKGSVMSTWRVQEIGWEVEVIKKLESGCLSCSQGSDPAPLKLIISLGFSVVILKIVPHSQGSRESVAFVITIMAKTYWHIFFRYQALYFPHLIFTALQGSYSHSPMGK